MITTHQNALNAGELSPTLDGRTDISKYHMGVSKGENFTILPEGGMERRPGTVFISQAKGQCRLLPFKFSVDINYILEHGDNYIRFYKDGSRINVLKSTFTAYDYEDGFSASEGTNLVSYSSSYYSLVKDLTEPSAWATSTVYDVGDTVTNGGVAYICLKSHTSDVFATELAADDWEATTPGSDYWIELTDDDDTDYVIYEIYSPYSVDDIFEPHTTESADIMYIAHKSYKPQKLMRYGDTKWIFQEYPHTDGPFLDENIDEDNTITFTSSVATPDPLYYTAGTTGTITFDKDTLDADHVGSLFQIKHSRDDNEVETSAASAEVETDAIYVKGHFQVSDPSYAAASTWVKIWRKEQGGEWQVIETLNDAISYSGDEEEDNVQYKVSRSNSPRVVTLTNNNYWNSGVVRVDSVTSAKVAEVTVMTKLGDGSSDASLSACYTWSEGAWSDYRGYPKTNGFYAERLWWGSTSYQPATLFGSKVSDFENFLGGANDADAVIFTINDDRVNQIQWVRGMKLLALGSAGGEWTLSATNPDDPLTPTDVKAHCPSNNGSENIQPININNVIVFVERGGNRIFKYLYDYQSDSDKAIDATRLASHLFRQYHPVQMDYQRTPKHIIWIVRDDGQLIAYALDTNEDLDGFTRILTRTGDKFKSVAVIYGDNDDEVWVSVERSIDGSTVYYIEKFDSRVYNSLSEVVMLDCSVDGRSNYDAVNIILATDTIRYGSGAYGSGLYGGAPE